MDNRFEGKWQYRRLLLLTSRPPNINDVRSRRTSVPVRGLYQENRICVIAPSYTAPETPPQGIIAVYHQLIGISRIIFVEAEKRGLFFTVDLVSIMVVAPRWLQGICKLILILCLTNLHGECPSVHPSKHAEPMLIYCWPRVGDDGPTLNQLWFSVSCLLEQLCKEKNQYLLTCKVNRYCLLALYDS